ncbi:MAG TPA: methyltransferase domain-containing protein [Cellulomonas sp.]
MTEPSAARPTGPAVADEPPGPALPLDASLLPYLVDPVDHGPLLPAPGGLRDPRRGVLYPVQDSVLALLAGEARSAPGSTGPAPVAGPAGPGGASEVTYDGVATWYDEVMQDPQAHGPLTAATRDLIEAELGPGAGLVLDVACGTGLSAVRIPTLGYQVLGVDLSADQLRIARHRIPVVRADAAALPLRTGSVAAVVTSFPVLPDQVAAAREAYRVLAPRGVYVQANVHPVLNGSWSRRSSDGSVTVAGAYQEATATAPQRHATTIRGRVGSTHLPLDAYLGAPLTAGFRLRTVREFSEYPGTLPTSLLTTWTKG